MNAFWDVLTTLRRRPKLSRPDSPHLIAALIVPSFNHKKTRDELRGAAASLRPQGASLGVDWTSCQCRPPQRSQKSGRGHESQKSSPTKRCGVLQAAWDGWCGGTLMGHAPRILLPESRTNTALASALPKNTPKVKILASPNHAAAPSGPQNPSGEGRREKVQPGFCSPIPDSGRGPARPRARGEI